MKPHLYFWQGRWWVSRNGCESRRRGITLNDCDYRTFALAARGAAADTVPMAPAPLTQTQQRVLKCVREAGEISPNEVSTRLALDPASRKRAVKGLVERGLIETYGATKARVYRACGGGSVEGRVLEAVRYRGGSIAEIAKRVQADVDAVGRAVRKLEREGEVKSARVGDGLVWSAA